MPVGCRKFLLFALALIGSWIAGLTVPPTWMVERVALDAQADESGQLFYQVQGESVSFSPVPMAQAQLNPERVAGSRVEPPVREEYVSVEESVDGETRTVYYRLNAVFHFGWLSLLPALVAVLLCWVTREPITALLGGVVSGALILGRYDLTGEVLIPSFATTNSASILVLYLWLLGGLMGVWSRTGAAQAFAEFVTARFVRGPRSAKLVAWLLGVVFFQGGTVSTVLVGTTVKPIADQERVSHEELAYIVDSTASPIASQLAFNAWPGYVQAFIFVSGVSFLATESDRIAFFFQSVPFCFYAIFAVLGTFLLSVEKPLFLGKQLKEAMVRARETGALDAPDAAPLAAKELQGSNVPEGYKPHILEFFLPLGTLIALAVGTFIAFGSPNVHWAFGAALLLAAGMALAKGMSLKDLITGFQDGIKGVLIGSVILLLAITIGGISRETGGGHFLVEQLGSSIPYFILPVLLQLLTIVIAFSTGTSWGTYAVAFPLAMPLAWAVATGQGLAHPELFMTLCFAAVMDGSVYGDQCSPISDTTVLSSVCTGCDLMDHVKTQIPQASIAAGLAAICWTGVAFLTA
ncbi:MAG: sodium:proton antiporter [Gammaproteobacteria bacterium]|nr:sodium:proton antiporter [Gammaproteobacteria bacterium]MXW45392.1 sodium:proton antiporter [Gammaproteobacteria bacterium]MYD02500.1 sodium:proton antiporter [Gammaproteobacteria bacterium]MYI25385.1 sodium:proton antiporter [Gammaproteobacteria bacterium]